MNPYPTSWIMYFHHPDDNSNYELESYQKIAEIANEEQLDYVMKQFQPQQFYCGMFFYIKSGCSPKWEKFPNGGYWSYIIPNDLVHTTWANIIQLLSTNQLLVNPLPQYQHLVGLSISPKKTFSILKIWSSNKQLAKTNPCNLSGTLFENATSNFILFQHKK